VGAKTGVFVAQRPFLSVETVLLGRFVGGVVKIIDFTMRRTNAFFSYPAAPCFNSSGVSHSCESPKCTKPLF